MHLLSGKTGGGSGIGRSRRLDADRARMPGVISAERRPHSRPSEPGLECSPKTAAARGLLRTSTRPEYDHRSAVRAAHAALPEWRDIPPLVVKRLRII